MRIKVVNLINSLVSALSVVLSVPPESPECVPVGVLHLTDAVPTAVGVHAAVDVPVRPGVRPQPRHDVIANLPGVTASYLWNQ